MYLKEIKEHFITYKNAMKKIGLSQGAYLHWRQWGYIPYHQQVKIERLTNGVLKASTEGLPDDNRRKEHKK